MIQIHMNINRNRIAVKHNQSTLMQELSSEATDIDNLVKLVRSTNFKLLLDLNLQERYGIEWDYQ